MLSNDEFRNLSKPRKELFTKLLPALGISGRAVDMFEYPAPTKAIIEASNNVKYIASFNLSDKFENIEIDLKDFGIDGEKLIFKCWESEFAGKTSTINEKLVNPHNALMYMVKDVPTEPQFMYSDINVYLGENIFDSKFTNGKLDISVKKKYSAFVNANTKVYAYYPKNYKAAITEKENTITENEEFIITEYKL